MKRIQARYLKNQNTLQEYGRTHYLNNLEKRKKQVRDYQLENLEIIKAKKKLYYIKNKPELSRKGAIRHRKRLSSDIAYKLLCNLRRRVHHAVKGESKSASTLNLLGCSIEHLRRHLGSRFAPGMTWENYGKWHVDHIRPCSSFNLLLEDEQRQCFKYDNLQPLWARDNLVKNDKW